MGDSGAGGEASMEEARRRSSARIVKVGSFPNGMLEGRICPLPKQMRSTTLRSWNLADFASSMAHRTQWNGAECSETQLNRCRP